MPRITRKNQKIFAEDATNNGVFGSLQANDPTISNDPDVIQGRSAYANGWNDAAYSSELLPPLEEFQALQYLFSRQISYLFQEGIPEWNVDTTYYKGSIVKSISGSNIAIYSSIADSNQGNLVSDTTKWSLIYDSTIGYAYTNMTNLSSVGQNISNWSSNVTNCIAEIPQDINLTLSSGTLTLKAGSKVYQPNGSGVFSSTVLSSDVTQPSGTLSNGQNVVFDNGGFSGTSLRFTPITKCFSGSSAPSTPSGNDCWYDTTNNLIKVYQSNAWSGNRSFPIAIVTVSGGAISSIDQVFNGFGYIGSTIFALPGVKMLAPNGRNDDGTLKSTSFSLTSVTTRTFASSENYTNAILGIRSGDKQWARFNSTALTYDPDKNMNLDSGTQWNGCIVCTLDETAGVISNFTTKPAFHAVDYSDLLEQIDRCVHLTGDQTIDGDKTVINSLHFQYGSNTTYRGFLYKQSGGNLVFGINTSNNSAWQNYVRFNPSGETEIRGTTTTAVTPSSATDDSTRIATTAWVQSWANNNNASSLSSWSKGNTGYFKFKNGLIVQWGSFNTGSVATYAISFPTAFSNSTSFGFAITHIKASASTEFENRILIRGPKSSTGLTLYIDSSVARDVTWLAVGY